MEFLITLELKKALKRDVFSEAFPNYMNYIARVLVPLLNTIHRPAKADFGLRYINRDYPKDDYKLIENAYKVSNMKEMREYSDKLFARFEEIIK
jgi:hypothetical protein